MSQITCPRCNGSKTYTSEIIATNGKTMIKEICDNCDTFLRFAPQKVTLARAMAFKLQFGKNMGKTFEQIKNTDPGYLHWIVEESTFKQNIKEMAKLVLAPKV